MVERTGGAPMQARLPFERPSAPVRCELELSGLMVSARVVSGAVADLAAQLAGAGVAAEARDGELVFGVGSLSDAAGLPATVHVTPIGAVSVLWALLRNPSDDDVPAVLSVLGGGLRLSWWSGGHEWDEEVADDAVAALVASDARFVATEEAWGVLRSVSRLPVSAGRARMNLDGFIEITTSRPQLLEAAAIPGMFRIDDTHYGAPAGAASLVRALGGISWDGPDVGPPEPVGSLPEADGLDPAFAAAARGLAETVAARGAALVRWDASQSSRLAVMCALGALEALPAVVVCPPWRLWEWARAAEAFGYEASVVDPDAEVFLVTYRDLAARHVEAAALVFDELCGPEAVRERSRAGLARLDAVSGAVRIGVVEDWSDDPASQITAMSALLPGEFRAGDEVVMRYPGGGSLQLEEHISYYLAAPGERAPAALRRSGVEVVALGEDQRREIDMVLARSAGRDRRALFAEVSEMVGAGPAHVLGAKVAVAAARAKEAALAGRSVAVVCSSPRAATMIGASVLPVRSRRVDSGGAAVAPGSVVVVCGTAPWGDLSGFDTVVLCDVPVSMRLVDDAVGGAGGRVGAREVVVLHAPGTLDDRLSILAMRRWSGEDGGAELGDEELAWVLLPRADRPYVRAGVVDAGEGSGELASFVAGVPTTVMRPLVGHTPQDDGAGEP